MSLLDESKKSGGQLLPRILGRKFKLEGHADVYTALGLVGSANVVVLQSDATEVVLRLPYDQFVASASRAD
jgi:hypothetical protein